MRRRDPSLYHPRRGRPVRLIWRSEKTLLDPLRDPQQEVPVGICPICTRKVGPGDPAVKAEVGIAHIDCTEPEDPEDIDFAEKMEELK